MHGLKLCKYTYPFSFQCMASAKRSDKTAFGINSDNKLIKNGPEVIDLFSCSTQLNTKFTILVGIKTFISMINTTSKSLKARNVLVFQHFSFFEQLKFHAQLS